MIANLPPGTLLPLASHAGSRWVSLGLAGLSGFRWSQIASAGKSVSLLGLNHALGEGAKSKGRGHEYALFCEVKLHWEKMGILLWPIRRTSMQSKVEGV